MRVIVPGPLGWQSSWPIQMTRSPSTSLRAIAVFMMMPPDDRPRKKGGSMGVRSRTAQPFPLWRLRSGPCATPINPNIRKRYSDHVPRPESWTLNIQPLGQFRPHRAFLLGRSTLLSSVARLLHTAGGRAVPSLCGLLLARAQMPRRNPERPRFRRTKRYGTFGYINPP